jgi:DnaJ-class molecular chaperone
MSDLYSILGLASTATKEEIKKAYRSLSLKFHPDKTGGNLDAITKFQKISEAYETLGDEQRRADYDFMGKNQSMRMGGCQEMPFQDMEDILSAIFGGGGSSFGGGNIHVFRAGGPGGMPNMFFEHAQQQQQQKPTPIIKTITITMDVVLTGGKIPVEIERFIVEYGHKIFETETIYVDIPKGIDDNEILILRDKGNVQSENSKGDIKLFIKVNNNTNFERRGLDLIMNKNITLKESLCGFSFDLNYVNGKNYTLNNSSGNIIPPEYVKVIPNMGLTREGHTGNLLVHFHVDFPEKLSEEKMSALREIL